MLSFPRCKRLKSGTVEETILGGAPDPKDEDIKEDEDEGLDEDSLEEVYRQDSNKILYFTVKLKQCFGSGFIGSGSGYSILG